LILHGGYNSAASMLGLPDIGLISMTEMVYSASNMAAAVDIPVIIDVDDGFGDALNIMRTTREAIRGGLAGLYMEDQVTPKRSPSIGINRCISTEAMVAKLRAVVKAREGADPDFVIMARTHASRSVGMDDAVERSLAYADAGADMIFVDPGYDEETAMEEFRIIVERIAPHVTVVANMTENCGRPLLTTQELYDMGFKVIIYPLTAAMTAAAALETVFTELMQTGTTKYVQDKMWPPKKFKNMMGTDRLIEVGRQFQVTD
jgi:2-methylisocitrate lyase-like PEP mutase family enzyme